MSIKPFLLVNLNILLFTVLGIDSFGQSLQWAKQIGGAGWDEGTSIATDKNNNIYTVGLFIGTVDFDPGIGVFNLTSVGEKDAFICKLDATGNFMWAKQYGDSAAIDEKSSLGIDALGNLYTTNSFVGAVDFDPGVGSFYLTSLGWDRNVFIQKLDENGKFIWAKQISAQPLLAFPTPIHSNAVAVDASGNQYLTGYFDGTVDFDPDTSSTFKMTAHLYTDIFICKLNADGNFVWAKQFAGQTGGGVAYAITVDGNSNVYSTGNIGGTVDFDPGPGIFSLTTSNAVQTEIYISKLDALGNFVWAKALGPGQGSAIAVDDKANVYTCGWQPLPHKPVLNKFDSSANLVWAKELGGLYGTALALDHIGNVYTAGQCKSGTNDYDPGPGIFNLSGDAFISKLDTDGNFIWAGVFTSTYQININAIAVNAGGNVSTTGFFNGIADFDPSTSIFNLTSPAIGYDIFIHKLSANISTGLKENSFEDEIKIYPNPTEGNLTIEFEKEHDILNLVLRNNLGQELDTKLVNNSNHAEIQINGVASIYLLEIFNKNNQRAVFQIIKK